MSISASDILSAAAVRETTAKVLQATKQGDGFFEIDFEKLPQLAELVITVIREKYPDLNIPYHSRWSHFKPGGTPRLQKFFAEISEHDKMEQARRQFDLVIPSVLLDAGAGPDWQFHEAEADFKIGRSEGLGIASFYMFYAGKFSSFSMDPLRSDMQSLLSVSTEDVSECFQVNDENPLKGLEGRAGLLRNLGQAIKDKPEFFIGDRPGGLVDFIMNTFGTQVAADELLKIVLQSMQNIWPSRLQVDGENLGDVWEHTQHGYLAFHKLSQWLTYSLLEPLEVAGVQVVHLDRMTGLAEYRNGGLFVDGEVLTVKDKSLLEQALPPSHDLILEWRALTVQLLDQIAEIIREKLGKSQEEFPLVKILEGGTWWAGRKLAKEKRMSGSPPIEILSDGTVF